jgi:BASS family bile acid:Na+ symporter
VLALKARRQRAAVAVRPFPAHGEAREKQSLTDRLAHLAHDNLLWLLLLSYVVAAFLPAAGLWLRGVTVALVPAGGGEMARVTLPMLLLALLLFNAGLGVQLAHLKKLAAAPRLLLAGLAANLLLPVLYILAVSWALRDWHDPAGVEQLLLGLVLVASMPVAGSSAAWAQNANGNLALSLGLVLGSTLLSPLATPAVLFLIGCLAHGIDAGVLDGLSGTGTGVFLAVFVLLPSLLGIAAGRVAGEAVVARSKQRLKLVNSVILLVLNYSNAAVSLPRVVAQPDWDFLTLAQAVVLAMCVLTFVSGWLLARALGGSRDQRTALMFGLGMNNNGAGLVLASVALANLPGVMLPLILYTLVQHVVAGAANYLTTHSSPAPHVVRVPALPVLQPCRCTSRRCRSSRRPWERSTPPTPPA